MSILLTGAAGFVGRHFVQMHRVFGLGGERELVCTDNREPPAEISAADYVQCELSDVNAVIDLFQSKTPKVVVHLAGVTAVGKNGDLNVLLQHNLFEAARRVPNPPHFVLAGSAAEYGDNHGFGLPPTEIAACVPLESYARSKLACTNEALRFTEITGIPVTVLRFANVYGPGQTGKFIPIVIDAVHAGNPIVLNDKGAPERDFVYVTDICRAIFAAVNLKANGIYNIGSDRPWALGMLAHMVVTAVHDLKLRHGVMPKPAVFDLREGNGGAKSVVMDSSKAAAKLGWQPAVRIYDGLRRTVAHQLQQGSPRENLQTTVAA